MNQLFVVAVRDIERNITNYGDVQEYKISDQYAATVCKKQEELDEMNENDDTQQAKNEVEEGLIIKSRDKSSISPSQQFVNFVFVHLICLRPKHKFSSNSAVMRSHNVCFFLQRMGIDIFCSSTKFPNNITKKISNLQRVMMVLKKLTLACSPELLLIPI